MTTFESRENLIAALSRYQGFENRSHEYTPDSQIYKQLEEYFKSHDISATRNNLTPQMIHQALRNIRRPDCYEDIHLILQIFRNT